MKWSVAEKERMLLVFAYCLVYVEEQTIFPCTCFFIHDLLNVNLNLSGKFIPTVVYIN